MSYHVFISYRRAGASELAVLLYNKLTGDGYAPFLDMESMQSGKFDEQIYRRIDECSDVLVLLPENALNRGQDEEDWVRQEIAYALRQGKNVIPLLMYGFQWPKELPEDICSLQFRQGVNVNIEYFDATYQRICGLITYKPKKVSSKVKGIGIILAACACLSIGGAIIGYDMDKTKDSLSTVPISTREISVTLAPIATKEPVFTPEPMPVPTAEPTPTPTDEPTPEPAAVSTVNEDLICFGEDENGRLRWNVLSSDDEYTELISAACIAIRPFGSSSDWKTSSLRNWLNEDYLYRAFSSAERDAVCIVDEDAIRIPSINEISPIVPEAAVEEKYSCTYFSTTVCSDSSSLLYTISEAGALGVSSPSSELGVRIIVRVKNDFLNSDPDSNYGAATQVDSGPRNMSVQVDSNDNGTIRVRWDGKADELWVFLGSLQAIYAERDVSNVSSFTFEHAQPNTTYTINLYAGDKIVSQSITTPKAMRYDRFGATSYRSSLTWLDKADVERGIRPWDKEGAKYQAMTKAELLEKLESSVLYCTVSFTYTQKSTEHEFVKRWVLHSPSGRAYTAEESNKLPAENENWTYSFCHSIGGLMERLHVDPDTIESGTYTAELYFDNQLVGDCDFIII